jgi:imidazolonepropionase-like amidohydrolase
MDSKALGKLTLAVFLFLTPALRAVHLEAASPLAINDVTVIDGSDQPRREHMTVNVAAGRITYIGPSRENDSSERQIKGTGKFLVPGFIDTHAHAAFIDWPPDARANQIGVVNDEVTKASLRLLLEFGITTIRNPAAPTAAAVAYRDKVASGDIPGPDIRTAGDILNRAPQYDGLIRPVANVADVEREIAAQAAARVDFVKLYARLPPGLVEAAIRSGHAHGLKILGHLQETSWTEGARMGIDGLCHGASWAVNELPPDRREAYRRAIATKGAMRARIDWLDFVDPEGPEIQEMIGEIARRRIPVDPTLIAYATKFRGHDSRFLASPDLRLAPAAMRSSFAALSFVRDWSKEDFERGRRAWPKMQALIRAYRRGGILLTTGSDEPNSWIVPGPSLHTEFELLVEAGLSPVEVLTMATRNGAESLGLLKETGTIEVGKQADMVLLDSDPTTNIRNTRSISLVIKHGQVVKQAKDAALN